MTTVKQISYLKLLVRDLDAALMWYTEKLGFELRADYSMGQAGRWGVIGLRSQPDLSVALECPSMEVHGPDLYGALAARIGKGTALVLTTSDCRLAYRELVSRGVRVLSEPTGLPWGITMLIEDLDGNGITLLEPSSDYATSSNSQPQFTANRPAEHSEATSQTVPARRNVEMGDARASSC